jgi:hypothetical protein
MADSKHTGQNCLFRVLYRTASKIYRLYGILIRTSTSPRSPTIRGFSDWHVWLGGFQVQYESVCADPEDKDTTPAGLECPYCQSCLFGATLMSHVEATTFLATDAAFISLKNLKMQRSTKIPNFPTTISTFVACCRFVGT